jgi:CheY-like chemotaxis protein
VTAGAPCVFDGIRTLRRRWAEKNSGFGDARGSMAKLILIVEDDVDVAESVAAVLEAEGYRTDIAANGREALEHLGKNDHPDLILLDMMMPVMDGWKFREEQRKLHALASIPVLTVTADGDARGKAASIQAAGYIHKPVAIDSLLDEVERICGLPE